MSNELVVSSSLPVSSGGDGAFFPDRATEIRRIMATDRSRYLREGLDQELASILHAEADPEGTRTAVMALPANQSIAGLMQSGEGQELVAAWKASPGGFERQLERVQAAAYSIVISAGDIRSQRAFMARFDRDVTERARYHIYNELRNGSLPHVSPATQTDVAHFSNTEAGADLVKEWGLTAPVRIARVWARFDRFKSALSNRDDFDSFVSWYSYLKPAIVKKICRFLSE